MNRWLNKFNWSPYFDFVRTKGKVKVFKQIKAEISRAGKEAWNILSGRLVIRDRRDQRRLFYYYDYTVYYLKGALRMLYRRRKNNPFSVQQGPLNNSDVCTYVGNTTHYPGQVNGKRIYSQNRFIRVMTKNKDIISSKHKVFYDTFVKELINYREVLGGGVNTNLPLLKKMASKNGIRKDAHEILEIVSKACDGFAKFSIPKISPIEERDLENLVKLNLDASPGLLTKLLHGKNRKGSVGKSLSSAINLLYLIRRLWIKNWSLWEVLAREKDNKVKAGIEIPTRLVLSMEEPHMLINAAFGQKLTKGFACSTNDSIFVGKKLDISTAERLSAMREKRAICFKADWSNFDLYVTADILKAAFSILRCSLPKGDQSDRFVNYSYKTMQDKYVCVNPGYVYRITKGLPSGHPLTSIIGTIVNIIYWHIIMHKVYGDGYGNNFDIVASGDDSMIFCDYHANLDRIDEYIEEVGLVSDKITGTLCWTQHTKCLHERPAFLQKHFDVGEISFSRTRFIRRLCYPTKRRDLIEEDIKLMQDYVIANPLDSDLAEFVLCVTNLYAQEFQDRFALDESEFVKRWRKKEAEVLGIESAEFSLMVYHNRIEDVVRSRSNLSLGLYRKDVYALNYLLLFPLNFIELYYGLLSKTFRWVPP